MGFFLNLAPLLRIGLITAAISGLIGGYAYWHHSVYRSGYDAAISAIAAQDKEAIDAADQARERVRACRTSGGVWSTSDGKCSRG